MTAVIHHGAPGSFKSFSIVQRVMIPALMEGREVVTNIRGFNDIDQVASAMGVEIPDTAKIHYVHADSEEGFNHMAKFFHWVPAGALIVIDEGQRVYSTRLRSFSEFDQPGDIPLTYSDGTVLTDSETGEPVNRPSNVENAFDQHRHCNWDIYIATTNIGKVHKEIRGVVEFAYRHRDLTGLLPWNKKPCWREFKHDAEASGKSVSHYVGTPKKYSVDKRVFKCYQSTKTGVAKDSAERTSILRDPKIRFALALFIGSIIWIGFQVSTVLGKFDEDPTKRVVQANSVPIARDRSGPDADSVHGDRRVPHQNSVSTVPPLSQYPIYFVGSINDSLLFHVHTRGPDYIVLTSGDLDSLGYDVNAHGAFVEITHGEHRQIVYSQPSSKPSDRDERSTVDDEPLRLGANF